MAKKLKNTPPADDVQLAETVRASAKQIWQAGLGAFAKAQDEGGKVFAKLVKEGSELQKRTKELAEDKVSNVSIKVGKLADDVGKQASGSWDKLEQAFEGKVLRSLEKLGIPTQKEIKAMNRKLDALSKAVATLSAASPKTAKPPAKRTKAKTVGARSAVKAPAKSKAKPSVKKTEVKSDEAGPE